jgi:hypothetical protein
MRIKSRFRRAAASLTGILALVCFTTSASSEAAEPETDETLAEEQLYALAPHAAQIVNLAQLDPVLAARLVPEIWLDSLTTGAIAVEAEVAVEFDQIDPPHTWPIGPWRSPTALVTSIEAVNPGAVASLYRALRPRIAANCRKRKVTAEKCEAAIRSSVERLTDRAVLNRASGEPAPAMTPTQRELARLGEPVVIALRTRLGSLGLSLWGGPPAAKP